MIHPGRQITPVLTRKGPDRQFIWRVSAALILALNILALTVSQAHAQLGIGGPTAAISGSYTLSNGTFLPGFFTWGDAVTFTCSGWFANDTLTVHMFGPQNQPGVTATDTILGTIFTDGSGKLVAGPNTTLKLAGIRRSGEQPPTLRPGFYSVWAQRPPPTTFQPPVASAANNINLSPRTVPLVAQFPNYILWDKERGARDGQLGDFSPEREDPEYVSAWDERPVSIYATVAPTGPDGGNQPAFVSHADYPGTHFAHDLNLLLVPDPQYKWIIADANYDPKSGATAADSGRIEWEWETQNGGSPYQYGQGTIGVPLWVTPTAGDRIFTVGRWVMDNGHPDQGDRTEIHPGRMIATMRKRNTAVTLAPAGKSVFTRASQVDVFVSGHGGGANMYPDQLESLLNNVGIGGGSLLSLLSSADLATYEASGPTSSITAKALVGALSSLGFINGSADQILPIAGPSGLGWLNGGEFRPVNDMDYDFDVPLPRIPAGATKINVTVITHAEHATGVNEVITYTNPNSDGLPTVAHIHLPYRGADSGIYARTYYFYWDKFSPPGNHYRVQLDEIAFFEHSQTTVSAPFFAARNMMFADVCGQWTFLTAHDPDRFLSGNANAVAFPVTPFDVFLDPQDTLRVFTQGYDQEPIDQLFGAEVGKPTYDVGFDVATLALAVEVNTFLQSYGENVDLGGALFDDTIAPGLDTHGTDIIAHANTGYFFEGFSVKYLKRPPVLTTAVSPPTMGVVCVGGSNSQDVLVTNTGESDLVITSVSTVGAGYSVLAGLPTPVTLAAGATVDLTVTFKPGAPGQGAGILSIVSNDPL